MPLAGESEFLQLEDGYLVRLTVRSRSLQSVQLRYGFELKIAGHFSMRQEVAEDRAERLARANGSAMLYSVARVVLAMLSGVGDSVSYLPAINFAAFIDQELASPPVTAKVPASP